MRKGRYGSVGCTLGRVASSDLTCSSYEAKLVGIGAIEPSPLLAQSGNNFAPQELDLLRHEKAVGDILLRFFDQDGNLVETGLEKRVISMS